MKRTLIIILCGAVLGLLAGVGVYYMQTAPQRAMMCCEQPELAWLQQKFQLTDAQFTRVKKLHTDYLAHCAELCMRIAATNELVRAQISTATNVTSETEQLLASAAHLRVECQKRMMEECFAVSREMSPEQGKNYCDWVQDEILAMPQEQMGQMSSHAAHGH